LTGDSDNDVESAGESPVPTEAPEARDEPRYRPLRGWSRAYEPPPPSLWSRIGGAFARLFARTPRSERAEQLEREEERNAEAIAAEHLESAADESDLADVEWHDEAAADSRPAQGSAQDDAFFYPTPEPAAASEPSPEPEPAPPVEAHDDLNSAWLERVEEEAPVFEPVMRVVPEKPPGFFARLFGRGKRAQPVEPEADLQPELSPDAEPAGLPADASSEPSFEPATPADRADIEALFATPPRAPEPAADDLPLITEFEERAPTLDDVLPMGEQPLDEQPLGEQPPGEQASDEALGEPPFGEEPTEPMEPAADDVAVAPKPGFFARLFGRRQRKPEVVASDVEEPLEVEPVAQDAFAAFEEDARVADGGPDEQFSSVADALPTDADVSEPTTPIALPFARTLEPESREEPAATASTEPFFFDAPAPPASFGEDIGAVDTSRPTIETEPVEEPEAAPALATAAASISDETTDEFTPPEQPPEVSPEAEAERPPFFVPKFRAFYNEIVHFKNQKSDFSAGFSTAIVDYTADLSADASAQTLSAKLQQILELQAAEASWMGGEAAARYPDAQYAMAALADEMFTHLEWPGKEAWPKFRLEPRMYRSYAADVEFFKRVDKLLKNEAEKPSAAARDLARMYLLILASGFQGKYRPFGLTRPLAEYRRRLYEFVYGEDPLLMYADERQLFPEIRDRTLAGRAVARFSMLQQWAAVLILLLIGYAVVSQIAWNRVSAELKDVTARVEAANASATSDGVTAPVQP